MLTHAVIDSLLGAAGLGDIGQHYPDNDERWRDADSIALLEEVCGFLGEHGWVPRHLDATVLCEAAEARALPRPHARAPGAGPSGCPPSR